MFPRREVFNEILGSLMSKVYNIIFFNKKWKTVFYNSLILLTLYKTNEQNLKSIIHLQ